MEVGMRVNPRQKRLIEDGLRNEIRRQHLLAPAMAYVTNAEDERGEFVLISFGTQNVIGEATVPSVKRGQKPFTVKTPIAYEVHGRGSLTLDMIEQVLDKLIENLTEERVAHGQE